MGAEGLVEAAGDVSALGLHQPGAGMRGWSGGRERRA